MLSNVHLKVQINEAIQILMKNYNKRFIDAKIEYINCPVI